MKGGRRWTALFCCERLCRCSACARLVLFENIHPLDDELGLEHRFRIPARVTCENLFDMIQVSGVLHRDRPDEGFIRHSRRWVILDTEGDIDMHKMFQVSFLHVDVYECDAVSYPIVCRVSIGVQWYLYDKRT